MSDASIITGHAPLPKDLARKVRRTADDGFCVTFAADASLLPAPPKGWVFDMDTLIAVKMKGYCDPHRDDFMGRGEHAEHRSFFWLVSDTSSRRSHLMAGGESCQMSPGDWAIFDDSKLHAFMARGTWVGVAVQMRPSRAPKK